MRKHSLTVAALLAAGTLTAKDKLRITCEASNGVAQIRIDGYIGGFENNAASFRAKVEELVAQGVKDANIYIHTKGGSVFDANEMENIIARFPGTITGEGGALVASAGTHIASRIKNFGMPKNGMYMWHKPEAELEGNQDEIKANLVLLDKLTDQYRATYARLTGQTEDQIEARWSKGPVWLNATEAKAQGFIQRITDEVALDAEAVSEMQAWGAPKDKLPTATAKTKPAPTPTLTQQEDTMDIKLMRTTLGMPESATEAEVLARVAKLQQETARHLAEAEALRQSEIKTLIDAAVKDRKITEAHRKGFEAKFSADFAATKAELASIEAVPVVATGTKPAADAAKAVAGREAWTYDQWMEKDEEGLNALRKSDPAAFQALAAQRYGAKAAAELFPIA